MRILIFSEVFWPEDFIINDLAREWVSKGHKVEVVTQYPSYPQGHVFDGYNNNGNTIEDWEGIKIHRFPLIEGYRDSKVKKILNYNSYVQGGKRIVDTLNGKFDCSFISQTGPLTVAYPALYAKKKYNIPVNIWTFDIWPDAVWFYGIPKNYLTETLLDKMIKNIYNNCDRIFVSSMKFSEVLGHYTDKECIYTPNWMRPVENVKSEIKLPIDKTNFTFTGNISRYQNLINVIEGFHEAELEKSQLNIIGDGSYIREVKSAADRIGEKNVVFWGRRPYEEMQDILSQSQVLILPLVSQEGIEKTEPYKIQSYLQAEKPIFGILNGAGREIIEQGLGLCSSPINIDEIAAGFKNMDQFAKECGELVKIKARKLKNERFNKHIIVERITRNLVC